MQDHPTYKLIIAANRDEFLNRPTASASFWNDHPELLAGRDLRAMGTWMGITRTGRFATLTNYRNPVLEIPDKISRGEIITDFLTNEASTETFLNDLQLKSAQYNGFNLLAGTVDDLYYYSNQLNEITPILSGTHSVSNHLLNTAWPKVTKAKTLLNEYVQTNEQINLDKLFDILNNRDVASDENLPKTGVSIELERQLSSIFINIPDYGTRSSTIILVTHNNEVVFTERTYSSDIESSDKTFTFKIEKIALSE